MLKHIPKKLSPELVKTLMEMGHGDELVIADGNYPAASNANILVRADGVGGVALLEAILELMPLDSYVTAPVALMAVSPNENFTPAIWDSYTEIIREKTGVNFIIEQMERSAFYERGSKAYAIVATGEEEIYANILLRKGVVQ
ncbi:L-fucose mutarotase [Enterococcus sp. AZ194]|uniref:RbsD/FucU family protein n=1 Tax=Enterococcus sp. AZ194 TaxID=2774629 RepID=UPI003F26E168